MLAAREKEGRAARPRARSKVAERIATVLRKAIVDGRLRPGEKLPSERELAGRYAVNRSSIREAMKRLEAWGLVKIRHGGATRVSELFLQKSSDLLPQLLELGAKVDPAVLKDLHEIRALLLGWCAEQAALKADPSSVERLHELVRQLESRKGDRRGLQELDYAFFEQLVAITGNRLLGLLGQVVRQVYLGQALGFEALYAPKVFDLGHHKKTVEAIRRRDAQAAGAAMRLHALSALMTVEY
jgi:GntR family transcriptional repressor for pyruvate dehydrogenase complex